MQYKISGVRVKQMPSKYKPGTFWNIAEVKLDGHGEEKFELQGFGSKQIENLKEGNTINGYLGEKEWSGNITRTLNKISAEYLYDLMVMNGLKMELVKEAVVPMSPQPEDEDQSNDNW